MERWRYQSLMLILILDCSKLIYENKKNKYFDHQEQMILIKVEFIKKVILMSNSRENQGKPGHATGVSNSYLSNKWNQQQSSTRDRHTIAGKSRRANEKQCNQKFHQFGEGKLKDIPKKPLPHLQDQNKKNTCIRNSTLTQESIVKRQTQKYTEGNPFQRETLAQEKKVQDTAGRFKQRIIDEKKSEKRFRRNNESISRQNFHFNNHKATQKKQLAKQPKQHAKNMDNWPVKAQKLQNMSRINHSRYLQETQPKISYPEGLPNIGNTCHLNSIIQFLFGASQYRDLIVKQAKKLTKLTTIKVLGELFTLLMPDNKQSRYETYTNKKQFLNVFIENLEKMNLNYRKYQQQDAFETLNNMLNNLKGLLPSQQDKIKYIFSLEVRLKCSCLPRAIRVSSMFPSLNEICQGCRKQFQKIFMNTPDYIILTEKSVKPSFPILDSQYHFVSSIVYSGSGQCGHYVCLRKENGVYYEISDSTVKKVYDYQLNRYGFETQSSLRGHHIFSKKSIAALYARKTSQNSEIYVGQKKEGLVQNKNNQQYKQSDISNESYQNFQAWVAQQLILLKGTKKQKLMRSQPFIKYLWSRWAQIKKDKLTMNEIKIHGY